MHDAAVMGRGKTARNLRGHVRRLIDRQAAPCEPGPQRLTRQQLAHEVRHPVSGANVVHDHDVGMVERSRCARFLLESPEAIGIGAELTREQLHGDVAVEPCVVRSIHLAHTASPHRRQNPVRAERTRW